MRKRQNFLFVTQIPQISQILTKTLKNSFFRCWDLRPWCRADMLSFVNEFPKKSSRLTFHPTDVNIFKSKKQSLRSKTPCGTLTLTIVFLVFYFWRCWHPKDGWWDERISLGTRSQKKAFQLDIKDVSPNVWKSCFEMFLYKFYTRICRRPIFQQKFQGLFWKLWQTVNISLAKRVV